MLWRLVGGLAFVASLAATGVMAESVDAVLGVLVTLTAAGTAFSIALGRPVARWVALVLLVVPTELAAVELLIDIPSDGVVVTGGGPTGPTPLQIAVLLLAAAWAGLLLVLRPHAQGVSTEWT